MTKHPHRLRRTVVLLTISSALLAACTGAGEGDAPAETPVGPHVPTGPASTLTPQRGDGETVELDGAGSLVAPADAQVEDVSSTESGAQQVNIRMPDADESGLPAVQVTWGPDDVGVFEQSWTSENAAKVDGSISQYVRSIVQWPGSAESVVATWEEDVALTTGDTLPVSATRLTVQDDDGTTVTVLALAPRGQLEGSEVEGTLRSLELG
ncbi:MAG: hypothetical protein IR158_17245 [Cellulomonas sp.]|uniref:hypothetical protein n=1 Tax=Cellulomonas sp. TaxID=40001 RepID=UPI001A053C6F|nr:hypothetical protein [Cellulomonas sp.]MBF0689498.1 hypothetical protein [Cellulomonas sp.]